MSYRAKKQNCSEEKLLKGLYQAYIQLRVFLLTRRKRLHKVLQGIVTEREATQCQSLGRLPSWGWHGCTAIRKPLCLELSMYLLERERVVGKDQIVEILEGIGAQLGLSLLSSMYDIQLEAGQCHDLHYKITLVATEAVQIGHNVKVE